MLGRQIGFLWCFICCISVFGFVPAVADIDASANTTVTVAQIDGQNVADSELSEQDTEIASNVIENEEAQAVISYESMLVQMGWDDSSQEHRKEIFQKISELKNALKQNLEELSDNYKSMKENEQSLANRTLTAATTAMTGIGGMEMARGLSEQKADRNADSDMTAYIETFRCEYGDGKSVKSGPTEIELPGGNDQNLMNYRAEYLALAADLKERKEALGMKPGIESEVILDKSQIGLYDDENTGITNGVYASLYRAKTGNETDQSKINEEKEKSDKRVKIGGAVATTGVVVGVVGNHMINKDVKNRADEILAKREDIKKQLDDVMQFEIDDCNAKIQEAKEWAKEQKNTADYKKNSGLRDWVTQLEQMEFIDDINKLKDHPICD